MAELVSDVQWKQLRRSWNHFIRISKYVLLKTMWFNLFKYIVLPIVAVLCMLLYEIWIPVRRPTIYLAVVLHVFSMISLNAGYHRYFTHKSYKLGKPLLLWVFVVFGSSVGLESIKTFRQYHLLHHQYCNTNKDPHNFRQNIVWAHFGWRVLKNRKLQRLIQERELEEEQEHKEEENKGREVSADKVVAWQDKYNALFYVLFGLVVPAVVCGYFWDDYAGGLVYCGILRCFVTQQSYFSINSLGHLIGSRPYSDKKTPRDSFFVAFLTFGEGYQNFHHQFPSDYRNGGPWKWDPTKVFLQVCSRFSVFTGVSDLASTKMELIERTRLLHEQELLDRHRAKLNWGVPVNKLPIISIDEFKQICAQKKNKSLTIINGVVHDISPFMHSHPGGYTLIKSAVGKDATHAFNGAVYSHSNAANNLLATMRIALIRTENTNDFIRQNTKRIRNVSVETADAA